MASCSQPPPPPPPDPAIRSPSHPSDLEVAKMLRALVDPSASPPSSIITIHEADVYAQDPADLTKQFPPTVAEDGQKAWYFSTRLLPKSRKRKRRCMDSGVWHDEGKSKSKPVVGSEARRYLFSFINKVDGKKGDRTGWIMHEFRLPVPDGNEESPVVLCKVFRSSRRCPPNPNESAAAEVPQAEVEVEEEAQAEVEVQAEAQAEVEVQAEAQAEVEVEEEARVKAVEAREVSVEAREAAVKVREAAVAAREALGRREAADLQERQSDLAASEAAVAAREALGRRDAADLQERQSDLAAREAALPAREAAVAAREAALGRRDAADLQERQSYVAALEAEGAASREWAFELLMPHMAEPREVPVVMGGLTTAESRAAELVRLLELRLAELAREEELWEASLAREAELREAESEALARREEARLAEWERSLLERERNLAAREFDSIQEMEAYLMSDEEALVLIVMAAAALVARAGLRLLLPSRPAVPHCGGALEPLF